MTQRDKLAQTWQAGTEDVCLPLHEDNIAAALNAAHLAIDEYYNGDREFAETWLLKAMKANKQDGK